MAHCSVLLGWVWDFEDRAEILSEGEKAQAN